MRATKNRFSFKQFLINQDNCAMKVCTDACIFGAFVPVNHAKLILDIGTGTGLLTLMLAQRCEANILGIEIDSLAAAQAKDNVANSNWKNQIHISNISLQDFTKNAAQKYDLLISNPPFFQENLLSTNLKKNTAKHNQNLTLIELASSVADLLAEKGIFWVMLPEYEMKMLEEILLTYTLFPTTELCIKTKESEENYFRVIKSFEFGQKTKIKKQYECIKLNNIEYSEWFKLLLKDYYLNL